jgi:hypothetical protein
MFEQTGPRRRIPPARRVAAPLRRTIDELLIRAHLKSNYPAV